MQAQLRGNTRGFSLIELMVALTIFSIVMLVGVGTLLTLIDANGKAQALSSAMTNLSFAFDSMTRNIRTGKDHYCVSGTSLEESTLPEAGLVRDCGAGSSNNAIVFTPGFATSTRIAYRLNETGDVGVIEQWIDKVAQPDSWIPITSAEPPAAVDVDSFELVVVDTENTESGDYAQPNISLIITGTVQNGLDTPTEFELQSEVTQRVLNF